jgi:hypothetical protein
VIASTRFGLSGFHGVTAPVDASTERDRVDVAIHVGLPRGGEATRRIDRGKAGARLAAKRSEEAADIDGGAETASAVTAPWVAGFHGFHAVALPVFTSTAASVRRVWPPIVSNAPLT